MSNWLQEMYDLVDKVFDEAEAQQEAATNNLISLLKNRGVEVVLKKGVILRDSDGDHKHEFGVQVGVDGGHFYEGFDSREALDAALRLTLNTIALIKNVEEAKAQG